jgi:hypothetical protein
VYQRFDNVIAARLCAHFNDLFRQKVEVPHLRDIFPFRFSMRYTANFSAQYREIQFRRYALVNHFFQMSIATSIGP